MNAGCFYSIGYIFSLIFSTLWLQSLGKEFSIFLLLLNSSALAIIFFNGINFKSIIASHKIIKTDFKNWLCISVYLTLTWIFTYLGAIADALILLTVVFLANALFASVYYRDAVKFFINLIIILLIYWINRHDSGDIAVFYGMIAGLFSFLYFSSSVHFAKNNNLSAIAVLSIRFYIFFIFSLLMFVFYDKSINFQFGLNDAFFLICLAVFNQILPNFFSQSAVQKVGAEKFSFFATLIPFLTFIGNGIMYNQWSISMCILTLLATLSLNYDIFSDKLK